MPQLGNPVAGGSSVSWTNTDLLGHFHIARFAVLGSVIPTAFKFTSVNVNAQGPSLGQPTGALQVGLYDASNPTVSLWPLVAASPVYNLVAGSTQAWRNIPWNPGVLPAGTYALSALCNSAAAFTGSLYYTAKPTGPAARTFITAGVFPNPLGGPPGNNLQEYSIYLDWSPAGGFTPTAACCCQPRC